MKIFITGATGFLGQYLVNNIAPLFDEVYLLTRNCNQAILNNHQNIKWIKGDITNQEVVDDQDLRKVILNEIDVFLHAAALYDVQASYSDCYLQNVLGTQNILRLAKRSKSLKVFYYISTIAVGDDNCFFLEEDILPSRSNFTDHYSETKYLAEKLVRETMFNFPTRIIRPGIIVGDSESGEMSKIDGPYYFMFTIKKYISILEKSRVVPLSFNPQTRLPIIPVDHCARFVSLLIQRDKYEAGIKTYHLISEDIPSIKNFLDDLNLYFGLKVHYLPFFKNTFSKNLLSVLGIPPQVYPFMFSKLSYDKSRTLEELPELKESRYGTFKDKIFGIL